MTAPWIAAFASLWLFVVLLGLGVVGVMRRIAGVLERAEHLLSTGFEGASLLTAIPPFDVVDDAGRRVASEELIRGTTIVVFMDAGCRPCRALATELDGSKIDRLPLIVIAGDEGLGEAFGLPPDVPVFRQRAGEVSKLFRSVVTPHAFVIDEARVVLDRGIPQSVADLERMAERQQAGAGRVQEVVGR
jgi:hypothetical protein